MRTVDKALRLLKFFSVARPEAGLSEIARLTGLDKATVLRMLSTHVRHGLLEQDPGSKKYRLGPAVLQLARVREASFPVASIIQPVLERLASLTGETAHASLAGRNMMMTVGIAEPQRRTRVHLDPSEPLPFHATASGLAYLAYAADGIVESVLGSDDLDAFTEHTLTSPDALRKKLDETRRKGFSVSPGSLELEVVGIAAPIFDWSGYAQGAVAVASLAARMTRGAQRLIAGEVVRAAVEVTRAMGAEPDPGLLKASEDLAA